ncbi:MobV family relaxase [Oceanisphaera sp. IT1-181]|uniref:MobV family relaxase n=1 Tax=Oceanisphaera sp. IT1-181 TaxID=3081199 RepID=UPI0029CA3D5A|nr:MobV family relaxase [Oceanisphaera sp. IT1-181]
MSYAILRTAKLKSFGEIGGSLAHNYREIQTLNADESKAKLNDHIGGLTAHWTMDLIKARLPKKYRSDAVLCVEYLITASPEYFEAGDDGTKYFEDAVDWLKARHGAENVVATTVHRDETSPHLVAYVVPLDDKGKLNAKKYLGGRVVLRNMQSDFAKNVGEKYGLERGIEGSKATHTTLKQHYGTVNKEMADLCAFTPDAVAPIVKKKGVLRDDTETYEELAHRLSLDAANYYKPFVVKAATATKRAKEIEKTAKAQLKALRPLQELTEGLSVPQMSIMMGYADEMRMENELAAKALAAEKAQEAAEKAAAKAAFEAKARVKVEAERRVAALQKVSKQHMTAGMTFGIMALKAIAVAGDWEKVDWPKLEQEAIASLIENEWPADQALKAILDHSPDRASLTESEISLELSKINPVKITNEAAPAAPKPM